MTDRAHDEPTALHPEHLLADLVSGSLAQEDRGVLDAHLAGCARCRGELDLARAGASAARALVAADVPLGLMMDIESQVGGRTLRRTPMWTRVVAAVAAVSMILGGVATVVSMRNDVAVVATGFGGGDAAETDGGSARTDAPALAEAAPLPAVDATPEGLQELADITARSVDGMAVADILATAIPETPELSCVLAERGPDGLVAQQVLATSWNGGLAYVGSFVVLAQDRPIGALVIVADAATCTEAVTYYSPV